jgi:hypothetical protein
MGADFQGGEIDEEGDGGLVGGYKTGTSTPGYRQEGGEWIK